jgi:hypothetical protein
MSGATGAEPSTETGWRARLGAPALAALAVLCCLGAPLIVGALGSLTIGAVFGILAGGLALLALCLWVARRLTTGRGC